CQQYNSLPLTV
nr:immunoglobulin light chain junction region [Macaca mulatta]